MVIAQRGVRACLFTSLSKVNRLGESFFSTPCVHRRPKTPLADVADVLGILEIAHSTFRRNRVSMRWFLSAALLEAHIQKMEDRYGNIQNIFEAFTANNSFE